jgi:hypothetical protein
MFKKKGYEKEKNANRERNQTAESKHDTEKWCGSRVGIMSHAGPGLGRWVRQEGFGREQGLHQLLHVRSLIFTAPSSVEFSTAKLKSLKNLKTKKCLRPQMDFITLCTTVY